MSIINESVTLTAAPQPSTLQASGALVSVGGTTLAAGTSQFCGTLKQVEALLGTAGNYAELQNMAATFFDQSSTPVVGVSVLELGAQSAPHVGIAALQAWITDNPRAFYGYTVPANWDTIPAPASPTLASTAGGTLAATTYYVRIAYVSAAGTIGLLSAEETQAVAADNLLTIDSPPALLGATDYNVYVSDATGTETLQNTAPIPIGTNWTEPTTGLIAGTAPVVTLAGLANAYSSPTGKTYFFITTSSINAASYGVMASSIWSGYKAAITIAPSPTTQAGEFAAAMMMYQVLSNNPGPANRLPPTQYRYVYGLSPWPATGYGTELATLKTYGCNYIFTGAEGGIGEDIIMGGVTASLAQISWWYGVDWFGIQAKQALAAAVINGSNEQPPLDYDQNGINALEAVAQNVGNTAVSYGCAASVVVTATPYAAYIKANPALAGQGIYGGFLASVVGQNGFESIDFYIDAIQI